MTLTAAQQALWANSIQRDCLLAAGDDVDAGLAAAEIILSTQPVPDKFGTNRIELVNRNNTPTDIDAFFAHDIHNRQAQGILNRAVLAAKKMSTQARKELASALRATGSGGAILDWLDKYRVALARILTTTQLAAVLEGAREVAAKVPPLGTVPTEGLPVAEQDAILETGDNKPTISLKRPLAGEPEELHFPTIEEAVTQLAERRVLTRPQYDALEAAARAKAFTVANVQATETLEKIRDSLSENIREGADYETWRAKVVEDVDAGTFLSDAHQETVFRTNVQTAFSDGQMTVLQHPLVRSGFPYSAYDSIHDDRVREEHQAMDGHGIGGSNIYRTDDPVFQTFRPPWDYNCRCSWTPITVSQAADEGVAEARTWLETGVEPSPPAHVAMPPFQPPPGFQRSLAAAPLSIQLSLHPMAAFGHKDQPRDDSGKWTNKRANNGSSEYDNYNPHDLSYEEKDAVQLWATSAWGTIKEQQKSGIISEMTSNFNKAIAKLPAATTPTYRGIALHKDLFEMYKVGKHVMFEASESYSTDKDWAEGWALEHPRISDNDYEPAVFVMAPSSRIRNISSALTEGTGKLQEEHILQDHTLTKVTHTAIHNGVRYIYFNKAENENIGFSEAMATFSVVDTSGHEHRGKGEGGGQFISKHVQDSGSLTKEEKAELYEFIHNSTTTRKMLQRVSRDDPKYQPGEIINLNPSSFTDVNLAKGKGADHISVKYSDDALFVVKEPKRGHDVDYSKVDTKNFSASDERETILAGKYKIAKVSRMEHPARNTGALKVYILEEVSPSDDAEMSVDAGGHEHRGKGEGGGQFTSKRDQHAAEVARIDAEHAPIKAKYAEAMKAHEAAVADIDAKHAGAMTAWQSRVESRDARRAAIDDTDPNGDDIQALQDNVGTAFEDFDTKPETWAATAAIITAHAMRYTDDWQASYGAEGMLAKKMRAAGFNDDSLAKVAEVADKGHAAIVKAAERIGKAAQAKLKLEQALEAMGGVEPERPDDLEEGASEAEGAAYDAAYAKWEKDSDAWDRVANKQWDTDNNLNEAQSKLEEVFEKQTDKVGTVIDRLQTQAHKVIDAEEEADVEPEEPELPDEPEEPDEPDYPDEPEDEEEPALSVEDADDQHAAEHIIEAALATNTSEGRWITIGGHPDSHTSQLHVGGFHVKISKDGTILTGRLKGKKISELRSYFSKKDKRRARSGQPADDKHQPRGRHTPQQPGGTGEAVAPAPGGPGDTETGKGGISGNQPTSPTTPQSVPAGGHPDVATARTPRTVEQVNHRLDHFTDVFRQRGQHEVAEWMGMLKEHINSVGVESALEALGPEVAGAGEEVQYGGAQEISQFATEYLARNGISLVSMGETASGEGPRVVSTLVPSESGVSEREGSKSKGDVHAALQTLKNKLDETQHLPGLESSKDLGDIVGVGFGGKVSNFTADVVKKLDDAYGAGQWIVRPYTDEAYGGYGIFFPDRVKQIQQDARNTIWAAGENLAKYDFQLARDPDTGKVVGLQHMTGDTYAFGSKEYDKTIQGDARTWADRAAHMASSENGADIDQWSPKAEEGKAGGGVGENFPTARFMVSPAFNVVGISNEERAQGVTFKKGQEGRVHIHTRNGKAEIVPHSTWLKKEAMPVVFENDDTVAMAQAAVDAINALPESERKGQIYAPDIIKTADGYKVVEANPANEAGASGYLADNPFIIDAYASHVVGREPAHVKFIRNLLGKRAKALAIALGMTLVDAEGYEHIGKGDGGGQFTGHRDTTITTKRGGIKRGPIQVARDRYGAWKIKIIGRATELIDRIPGGKRMRKKAAALKAKLEERYGSRAMKAIVASGYAISWAAFGAGAAASTPIVIPSAIAMLPGLVIAELHHQLSKDRGAAMSTDVELTQEEIDRLAQEFVDALSEEEPEDASAGGDNPAPA